MEIEEGKKVKATCLNGEIYTGTLTNICMGIKKNLHRQVL